MSYPPGILARGPWETDQVACRWREDAYEVPDEVGRLADGAVENLRERGSPAHDGMATRLGDDATEVLRRRGVEVRLGTTVEEVTADGVRLSDGETIPTHTLVWCTGVTPSPLIETLGQPTERGRLRVGTDLQVPGHPDVFAFGDAAAVPDLTRPGKLTGQTAQHAQRQGKLAARNVAASLGFGKAVPYRHRDLGFAVDLGGFDAVASPFGVALGGLPGLVATRGYHLLALPAAGNRIRVSLDWLLDWAMRPQLAQLGFLREDQATMAAA